MSGGFAFPPPPPPPPRPSTGHQDQQRFGGQSRGRGRGRGGDDGRGGGRGRGRGGQHNDFTQRPTFSPPRTIAGHKRKLEALRGPQSDKSKKPGPQTAPAVPSFGSQILPPKPTAAPTKTAPPKRSLGLVPLPDGATYDDSESEEDDDLDEEAMFAGLSNQLTFEHNGVFMSLKSEADLMAWQTNRQKNFPTNARMAEKYEEKKSIGEERRRLLSAAEVLRGSSGGRRSIVKARPAAVPQRGSEGSIRPAELAPLQPVHPSPTTAPREEETQPTTKADEQALRLAELRRKVAESEARNRAAKARLQNTEETATAPATVRNEVQSPELASGSRIEQPKEPVRDDDAKSINESSLDSSTSGQSSEVSSDSDSEDSAPEEVTSKGPAMASNGDQAPLCKYFETSGRCRNGHACRFRHEWRPHHKETLNSARDADRTRRESRKEVARKKSGGQAGRKTIFERLVEQEQYEQDKLALQVIKYLGNAGLFTGGEDGEQT